MWNNFGKTISEYNSIIQLVIKSLGISHKLQQQYYLDNMISSKNNKISISHLDKSSSDRLSSDILSCFTSQLVNTPTTPITPIINTPIYSPSMSEFNKKNGPFK